jgi:hypothetical protein
MLSVSRLYSVGDRTRNEYEVTAGKREVLGENVPYWHFVHGKSDMT